MAKVAITLTFMPTSPEIDLTAIEGTAKEQITAFAETSEFKIEQKPVAFGLKSLNITFAMDEDKGDTESLEKTLAEIEGVNSVEVTDVRRTMG